jgi:hypothetical protein
MQRNAVRGEGREMLNGSSFSLQGYAILANKSHDTVKPRPNMSQAEQGWQRSG